MAPLFVTSVIGGLVIRVFFLYGFLILFLVLLFVFLPEEDVSLGGGVGVVVNKGVVAADVGGGVVEGVFLLAVLLELKPPFKLVT